MEIKYDSYNTWIKNSYEIVQSHSLMQLFANPGPSGGIAINEIEIYSFVEAIINRSKEGLSKKEINVITPHYLELEGLFLDGSKMYSMTYEADLNIVNINSQDQVYRYLKHTSDGLKKASNIVWGGLFCAAILKGRQDLKPNIDSDYFDFPISHRQEGKALNIVDKYLSICLTIYYLYRSYQKRIESKLPAEPSLLFKHEITANTHKLLTLYKTGVFEALYNKYYQHLGAVKFSRLIASIIGIDADKHEGFRPSVNELIKEMLNPNNKKIVRTEAAELKVNAFLTELGIDV